MNADFFVNNRNKLRTKLKLDSTSLVLLPAFKRMEYQPEQAAEFLQESNFYYLCGIEEPDCYLAISQEQEFLLIPDENAHSSLWDGQIDKQSAAKISGIDTVIDNTSGWQHLKRQVSRKIKTIYTPSPAPKFSFDQIYSNPAHRHLLEQIKADFPLVEIKDLAPALAEMRAIKQLQEIAVIKKAIEISINSIKHVAKNFHHGQNEREIDINLSFEYKKLGASGDAFKSIVASGNRGCTIHYNANNQPIKKGELLLIDTGARYNHYAADISRTIPVSSSPTSRQREVMAAVKSVYDFAARNIKVGVRFGDYEKKVEDEMGKTLKNIGLIKSADSKNIRQFFPHATSHMLGLEVHDVGTDSDTIFAENMILTIEPGIYIPEEAIGVRFEDDFLITKHGVENLCADLPLLM